MKLLTLIDLSLILTLTSYSKGQSWNISVPRTKNVTPDENVIIPCTFSYPNSRHTDDVQVYWKRPGKSSFVTGDKDHNQFVFHTNETFVVEKYRGRTMLVGNKNEGNCSLQIMKVKENEPRLYLRIITKSGNFSFSKNTVSISVSGVAAVTVSPDDTFFSTTHPPAFTAWTLAPSHMYSAIFVPLTALLIVVVVVSVSLLCMRGKRSQSFIRENSGYYANFSRSNDPANNRGASCKNQENMKGVESKVIDEPIYVNTEAFTGQMGGDHTHNIYGNIDYS